MPLSRAKSERKNKGIYERRLSQIRKRECVETLSLVDDSKRETTRATTRVQIVLRAGRQRRLTRSVQHLESIFRLLPQRRVDLVGRRLRYACLDKTTASTAIVVLLHTHTMHLAHHNITSRHAISTSTCTTRSAHIALTAGTSLSNFQMRK